MTPIKRLSVIPGKLQNKCNANTLWAAFSEAEEGLHGHQGWDRGETPAKSGDWGEGMKYCAGDHELWEHHQAGQWRWWRSQWHQTGALEHSVTLAWYFITSNLQVRKLRENISDLKVQVSSITKGIPISQWDILAGRWVLSVITSHHTKPCHLMSCHVTSYYSRERRKSDADISESGSSPESSDLTSTSSRGLRGPLWAVLSTVHWLLHCDTGVLYKYI